MMTIQQFRQHFGEEEQCWKHFDPLALAAGFRVPPVWRRQSGVHEGQAGA